MTRNHLSCILVSNSIFRYLHFLFLYEFFMSSWPINIRAISNRLIYLILLFIRHFRSNNFGVIAYLISLGPIIYSVTIIYACIFGAAMRPLFITSSHTILSSDTALANLLSSILLILCHASNGITTNILWILCKSKRTLTMIFLLSSSRCDISWIITAWSIRQYKTIPSRSIFDLLATIPYKLIIISGNFKLFRYFLLLLS